MKPSKWDKRFLRLAQEVSTWSKDPSTKTGAVIVGENRQVISVGFNGFPRGMADMVSRLIDREEKYSRTIHCEINALLFAPRNLEKATIYTWPFMPCDRCVVQLLQSDITRFVAPSPSADAMARWGTAFARARRYIREVGATVNEYDL